MDDSKNTYRKTVEIRSTVVQEILGIVPPRIIRWGNTLICLLVIGLIAVSYFIKYPDIVTAEAVISTMPPTENYFSQVDGEFEKILVADSQSVSKGTLLAVIKDQNGVQHNLISSRAGIVYFSGFWQEKMTLYTGNLLFKVAPGDLGAYTAMLKVPSEQLAKIKMGQQVQLNLGENSSMDMHPINGWVSKISNAPNEDGLFLVQAKLNIEDSTKYLEIIHKPDIIVNARIVTEDLRLLERIFHQLKDRYNN